jgi:hypothetical protein
MPNYKRNKLFDLCKDAQRYRWLRAELAAGRETDIAEGLVYESELDDYIDRKLHATKEMVQQAG